jgi:hypothetical protein
MPGFPRLGYHQLPRKPKMWWLGIIFLLLLLLALDIVTKVRPFSGAPNRSQQAKAGGGEQSGRFG